jgi:structural maintenance of chromosome 2
MRGRIGRDGVIGRVVLMTNGIQDLIYKRGQAGVTKASVTIVFDNSDSEKSPYGYNDFPQISVTRQVRQCSAALEPE